MTTEFTSSAVQFLDSVVKKDEGIRYVYGHDHSISAIRGLSIRSAVLWIRSMLKDDRPIIAIEQQPVFSYVIPEGGKEIAGQTIARIHRILDEAKFSYYHYDQDLVIKNFLERDTIVTNFGVAMLNGISSVRIILNIFIPSKINSDKQHRYTIHYDYQWGQKIDGTNDIYFLEAEDVSYILENGEGIVDIPDLINDPSWYLYSITFYEN